ncbi:glycoside hydrolase family 13 protein [Actinotalea sp.]|uniref:glycoside hydrolase family 13 protein n=1 Tax=Actinotalea sp. TaxID=1872145 RepID=UPI00356456F8
MTQAPPAPQPTTTTTLVHRAVPSAQVANDRWWRSAVIYQVYPRSFCDSDGDGIGDLQGITGRLVHLARLGVDALWLSPFYRSPQNDAGYDVADYREVDPVFGTLEDADRLVAEAHRRGMRVVIDLVPNHTSSDHPWFGRALEAGPGSPERARYVFRDGTGPQGAEPPNGWRSVFGGPAWSRATENDGTPGQWYLHLFDVTQPDLDWTNPEVRAEFESVLRFWLDRGIDGFRVDVAHGLVKEPGLPEMPPTDDEGGAPAAHHGPMWDQEGVHEIYREWRAVLDEYEGDRVLVAEAWVSPVERLARYVRPDEMHQAFNFAFLTARWDATALREVITDSLQAMDAVSAPTTWVLSNHDVVRHATRLGLPQDAPMPNGIGAQDTQPDEELGLRRARAASLLMLALPGSAYLYQGEELGLPEHTTLDDEQRQDPTWFRTGGVHRGRDGCRVPLPWSAAEPAYGFSPTGDAWLDQPASFARYALDAQRGVAGSTYEVYRSALRLRREFQLGTGSLAWVDGLPTCATERVLAFVNRDVLVLCNLGTDPLRLPADLTLLHASADLPIAEDESVLVPPDTTVWARLR